MNDREINRVRHGRLCLTAVAAALIALLCLATEGRLPASASGAPYRALDAPIEYNRDVRPILAENCFKCHGIDANYRQAGLRLDKAESALRPLASGRVAVVPGKPATSELFRRVTAQSPLVMPPVSTGKHLTERQIDL